MESRSFLMALASTAAVILSCFSAGAQTPESPLPWENTGDAVKNPAVLYLEGGFLNTDKGCPDWGTSDPSKIQFIGDHFGDIVVTYSDNKVEKVPLVLGYTLWMHGIWMENPAPFKGNEAEEEMTATIKNCLYLKGGFEGEGKGLLKIALKGTDVKSVTFEDNPLKSASPVFTAMWFDGEDPAQDFFADHTVKCGAGVPSDVQDGLDRICTALHTFESDFKGSPLPFEPSGKTSIVFEGSTLAQIASGVVQRNIENLRERTEDDGNIHTSYKDAPSWRYDGFGPYVAKANSYYDAYYSRDASRAIMTLNGYHDVQKAAAACHYGNSWMMFYPENGLTLGGKLIPGHFSVIPNKPLIYSQLLSKIGVPALCDDPDGSSQGAWPTRYTKKRFGDEYENLGNQETDGHGLMMVANWMTWKNAGATPEYVVENWKYINEAAQWLVWCFDNPDLSFVENDLLYGETEAAMNTYTLYANVPCYLGLLCYSEMAAAAGFEEEAARWTALATKLKGGIDNGLSSADGKGWNLKKFGFYHDPVVTMMADVYGYDTADMPSDWVAKSLATFDEDLAKTTEFGWYGPSGIGYNHSMMTQNSLLLDRMEAATELMESLSKLSYSPRLPDPYLVPEGLSVDAEKGVLRRQGDLGNLVQLAEALKCYLIAIGLSPVQSGELKIMPRLPQGWSVQVTDFPLQNTDATVTMKVSKVKGRRQSIDYTLSDKETVDSVAVRFGPFKPTATKARVRLNGKKHKIALTRSGDAAWGWVAAE